MSDIEAELLKQQYIYVPYVDRPDVDSVAIGKDLAVWVAARHGAGLTVVCPMKSNATDHKELAKRTIVTERSGRVSDGSVVLAWCPTQKAMDKVRPLTRSIVMLVEWPSDDYSAWARLNGAFNFVTQENMSADLNEAATEVLDAIVFDGYNGWNDEIARRQTPSHLAALDAVGSYDAAIVLEYARTRKGGHWIDALEKIIRQFEASRAR